MSRTVFALSQMILLPAHPKMSDGTPRIEIHEQPKTNVLRFRYATEGEKAGSIAGERSTAQHQTFPSVRLINCIGLDVLVMASCVTATDPIRPHPHRLVGPECKQGACEMNIKNVTTDIVPLTKIGIQCCKQKDIDKSIEEKHIMANKFYIGGVNLPNGSFDLTTVRLCFQLFVYRGSALSYVDQKVSNPIIDRKALNELVICRISRSSGTVRGGDEVFLLCSGIKKDDIEVVFSSPDGSWEAKGEFTSGDVHKQFAIVFKTPPYWDLEIADPVEVNMFLRCPSKNQISECKKFQYFPEDPDPYLINSKRKRKSEGVNRFIRDHNLPSSSSYASDQLPDLSAIPNTSLPIGYSGLLQPVANPQTALSPAQHPVTISFLAQTPPSDNSSLNHPGRQAQTTQGQSGRRRAGSHNTRHTQPTAVENAGAITGSDMNPSFQVESYPTLHQTNFPHSSIPSNNQNIVLKPEPEITQTTPRWNSESAILSDSSLPDDLRFMDYKDFMNTLESLQFPEQFDADNVLDRSLEISEILNPMVSVASANIPLSVANQSLSNDIMHSHVDVIGSNSDQTFFSGHLQANHAEQNSTEELSRHLSAFDRHGVPMEHWRI